LAKVTLAARHLFFFWFQGATAAKTLLFQSTQMKPTSMDGLLALCILGIKQSDGSLIKAALGEMEKRLQEKGGADYRPDFVSIKALTLVLQGKKKDARFRLFLFYLVSYFNFNNNYKLTNVFRMNIVLL
jgi:hypothetical protein